MRRYSPEALEHPNWPTINLELLSEAERKRFLRLQSAVMAACDGVKSGAIRIKYGVARAELSYFLGRCTAIHPDGRLWGFRALVKGCRQSGFHRHTATDQPTGNDGAGLAGAFQKMLDMHPHVQNMIAKFVGSKKTAEYKEAGTNLHVLHQLMLDQLKKEGVTARMYPFNTERMGYVSLTKYVKRLILTGNNEAAANRFGSSALDGLQAGTGKRNIFQQQHPLEAVAYDEQKLPFIGTIVIEADGQEIDVPIHRGYLCLLVSMSNGAILGYSIAISRRFRALDLLKAFETFIRPRKRDLRIPGLRYREGAELPCGVVPEVRGQRIGILNLDNHLTHLAKSVVGYLRRRTGVVIRFGKIRHWISRAAVEGIFAELQKRGFSRLASTTGSGPDDPVVDDPVGKAVKFKIRIEDLLEIIDVLIANHNATGRRSLMGKTPIEDLILRYGPNRDISIVPRFEEGFMKDPQIAIEIDIAVVRGSRKNGRRPYIQLDYGHYTNDYLQQSWSMIGQKLQVHIEGDFRKVRAFNMDGTEFGVLAVTGHWSHSFHTREMRKEINQLHDKKIINKYDGDPITAYSEHCANQAIRNHKKKSQKITRAAGDLAEAMHATAESVYRYKAKDMDADESAEPQLQPRGRRDFFS